MMILSKIFLLFISQSQHLQQAGRSPYGHVRTPQAELVYIYVSLPPFNPVACLKQKPFYRLNLVKIDHQIQMYCK